MTFVTDECTATRNSFHYLKFGFKNRQKKKVNFLNFTKTLCVCGDETPFRYKWIVAFFVVWRDCFPRYVTSLLRINRVIQLIIQVRTITFHIIALAEWLHWPERLFRRQEIQKIACAGAQTHTRPHSPRAYVAPPVFHVVASRDISEFLPRLTPRAHRGSTDIDDIIFREASFSRVYARMRYGENV